jgi:CHAT domain-containing protein
MLLTSNRAALERFEELAAANPQDAHLWNDLAVARYESGVATNDAALVAASLAAADTALRLQPALPEALFNRAAAIERLGIRDAARNAWKRFLDVDGRSEWATEAQNHIRRIPPIPFFIVDLRTHYDRLSTDAVFARKMARERPEETRLYGETVVLADWAAAAAAGDRKAAARHLNIAREWGAELARNRGECLLQQAVRAIESADAEGRQHLIRGHVLFREGQNQFKTDHAAMAQATFTRAADELAKGDSPVRLLAEFFLADTFDALGNPREAQRRELKLLAESPAEYRAHRAQLLWTIGGNYRSDEDFGRALDTFARSVAIFDDLGESDYAAAVRELIAEIHDRNGDPQEAWRQRVISLRGIGRLTIARLARALDDVGRGAMLRKEWPVALSFLQLAAETAATINLPTVETEVRLLQARAFAQTGNGSAAHATIATAAAAAARIQDAAARRDALADIDSTEALVATSPRVAVALLTRSIDHYATSGHRAMMPELFLLRGRAYRGSGQPALAAADFEAGIAEVEKYRQSLPPGESRWGTFDPVADLFEEAVASAIRRGDAAAAFAYAERSRARELLEALGASASASGAPASYGGDAVLVEYFSLPDRLIIFSVRRGAIHEVEERVERTVVERETEEFRRALAEGSPQHRQLGATLYAQLVAPVEREIGSNEAIVFIPGARFPSVPFAALSAGSAYLIERHTVVVCPSAAVYAQLAFRNSARAARPSVLVFANPATTDSAPLTGAEAEADNVAQFYANSHRLTRTEATVHAYRRYAPSADVIHMATHGALGALLLADGRLDSQTIASIALPRTHAVVLAACDSARGPARAEGTISAARGFLAAGVPAVVATLWKIDDRAAAQFFPRVHRDLARGLHAAAAVREAQIEAIQRGQSTALWAAIQCIGTDGG